ncbi:MAG: hypothetical protein JRJ87_22680 [Deltaproteobacteria bacterium]|nr:hypothetical protein [Deltaproteobacteria bacterium]
MRSFGRIAILGIAIIVAAQSCGSEVDYVGSTSFMGVKGEIIRIEPYCYSGCMGVGKTGQDSHPDSKAWIEAFRNGEIAGKAFTDDKGRFQISLSPGIYDIRIYPPESNIDEELEGILITDDGGISLRRSYYSYNDAWTIWIYFYADVETERMHEILEENNLVFLDQISEAALIRYKVEIPHNVHIQEVREHLEQNYGEIKSTNPIGYVECAA